MMWYYAPLCYINKNTMGKGKDAKKRVKKASTKLQKKRKQKSD